MAIVDFKKVENNKGYFVDEKDRKIFEREISKGYFGMNIGDIIEFVIYDSNDNQLPQESAEGSLVRYIEYNDNTEKKYFGKSQKNKITLKSNDSDEFFIDTEKLIREAGYSQGIFKTQISLVNRRLGSETRTNDKVWIHEISPSRTEVRLLPTIDDKTGRPNSDLEQRYRAFVECEIFAADVNPFIDEFINQFDVEAALKALLGMKGKVANGKQYIRLICDEFKINDFDKFLTDVKTKFVEAANHYKNHREYNILSINYGKPNGSGAKVTYRENEIYDTICNIVGNVIEYYLPKRDLKEESVLTFEQQKTLDKVDQLLKTVKSNERFKSSIPESVEKPVVGCMDPKALNYNPNADINDKSLCVYPEPKPKDPPAPRDSRPKVEPKEIVTPPPPPPPPIITTREKPDGTITNTFTDPRDIVVRGIGFDDELPMINIGGKAVVEKTPLTERLTNPSNYLVGGIDGRGGTGDLSIVPGSLPGQNPYVTTGLDEEFPDPSNQMSKGNYSAAEQMAARDRYLSKVKTKQSNQIEEAQDKLDKIGTITKSGRVRRDG